MFIKLILFMFINVFILAIPVGADPSNLTIETTSKVKIKIGDEALSGTFSTDTLDFGMNIIGSKKDVVAVIENIRATNTIEITLTGLGEKNSKIFIPKEIILISKEDSASKIKFAPELNGDITGSEEKNDSITYFLKKKSKLNFILDGELHDLINLKSGQYKGLVKMELITN